MTDSIICTYPMVLLSNPRQELFPEVSYFESRISNLESRMSLLGFFGHNLNNQKHYWFAECLLKTTPTLENAPSTK